MRTEVSTIVEFQILAVCMLAFLLIVAAHLIGLHGGLRIFHRQQPPDNLHEMPFPRVMAYIVTMMTVLFSLHFFTNLAWGAFMYGAGVLGNYRDCVYFSLENYTSLGLTQVTVADQWRMLAPMISLSGVFCLAWSTAVLVSVFAKLYIVAKDS